MSLTEEASASPVRFEEIAAGGGRRFGIATLDSEPTLNALSLAMIDLLLPRLRSWADDPEITGVVLQGAGPKGFCAGGDLRALYQSMMESPDGPGDYVTAFFEREYRLDHLIHTYPKPFLCWGHGIVMGGGIGLMVGASHRVATPSTRMAMPEITVGLYPDVGGTWFLHRMQGGVGLFLALTGAPLNAADARFLGLADVVLPDEARTDVHIALAETSWSGDAGADGARLGSLLREHRVPEADLPSSPVREHLDRIREAVGHADPIELITDRLVALEGVDPWLDGAVRTFRKGSPTSAALVCALREAGRHRSLAEVFRLEYDVSLGCAVHPDFREGIRALLVDRDRSPQWTPDRSDAVTSEWIAGHFVPRYGGAHPLTDLT